MISNENVVKEQNISNENVEIKEILDFKEDADYKRLSIDEITILRDYITNLQEENKELKAKLKMYENGVYFSSENDKLQERIDKAIEYIEEELTFYITIGGTDERKLIGYNKAFDELLKILKGSDKE